MKIKVKSFIEEEVEITFPMYRRSTVTDTYISYLCALSEVCTISVTNVIGMSIISNRVSFDRFFQDSEECSREDFMKAYLKALVNLDEVFPFPNISEKLMLWSEDNPNKIYRVRNEELIKIMFE